MTADAGQDLARHLAYLEEAVDDARRLMLSRKRALLAAHLVDAYADRLFAARGESASDVLEFRAGLASGSAALSLIFDLVAGRAEVITEAVDVPISEYGKLSVEDYMVSLYNHNTVQRVRIVTADGRHEDVHEVLAKALTALRR